MPTKPGLAIDRPIGKPNQAKPSQTKPSQAKGNFFNQTKPSQAKPSQAKGNFLTQTLLVPLVYACMHGWSENRAELTQTVPG